MKIIYTFSIAVLIFIISGCQTIENKSEETNTGLDALPQQNNTEEKIMPPAEPLEITKTSQNDLQKEAITFGGYTSAMSELTTGYAMYKYYS